jgi:hypothetical protein
LRDSSNDSGTDPSGITALLGGGYEWPLNGDLSVGVLGRFTLSFLSEDVASHAYVSPSVLATLTWF